MGKKQLTPPPPPPPPTHPKGHGQITQLNNRNKSTKMSAEQLRQETNGLSASYRADGYSALNPH